MSTVETSVGVAAAAAMAQPSAEPRRQGKVNAILAWLGRPEFLPNANAREYDRTAGFRGKNGKHPDGGTQANVAFVVFTPCKGSGAQIIGRIYRETFDMEDGKKLPKTRQRYTLSLSALQAGRGDAVTRAQLDDAKVQLENQFHEWMQANPKAVAKASVYRAAQRGFVVDVESDSDQQS